MIRLRLLSLSTRSEEVEVAHEQMKNFFFSCLLIVLHPPLLFSFAYPQIRRLSHHPSIIIWDGCNECHVVIGTPTGIYATFVLTIVAQEDASRAIWPSCPAAGWTNGVNRLTSLPNGSPLGLLPRLHPPSATLEAEKSKYGLPTSAAATAIATTSTAAATSSAPTAAKTDAPCTFQPDVDYDHGTVWLHPAAAAPVG